MAYKIHPATGTPPNPHRVLRMYQLQNPEIAKGIDLLYARYGKHAIPISELRKRLDKEMGEKTLTEELYAMREGR